MSRVWINGDLVDAEAASLPLGDSGLLHAAGVFTTMRADGGRAFRLADHLRRLRDSCQAFSIPLVYKDDALAAAATELLRVNELSDARLRLTVTRGVMRSDPLHGPQATPNVFMTATGLEPYPAQWRPAGMTVVLVDEQKLNPHDVQAGHKTLNYLSRFAALREAARRGAGEALWFDIRNRLQSGCISNVLLGKDGALVVPPTTSEIREKRLRQSTADARSCVLPGITRLALLELAEKQGIKIIFSDVDIEMLLAAEEVMICNSVMRLMPVCQIERHEVGTGRPGPLAEKLSNLLDAAALNSSSGAR
jgi:branched-chain amino acid aminotransferase